MHWGTVRREPVILDRRKLATQELSLPTAVVFFYHFELKYLVLLCLAESDAQPKIAK